MRVKLKDICEVKNGYAFKSSNYTSSGIRVIRITNVQKGFIEDENPEFYPISYKDELKEYMLKENDLLISLTGNVGRAALLSSAFLPAALNQRVGCIRVISDNIRIKYIYYMFQSQKFENDCINSSNGIAQKNMSTEWLKEYEIEIRNTIEQDKIINIFDKLARIISNYEHQLEFLDTLIKARFVEMFGDGMKNSNYEKRVIGDMCEIVTGTTPDTADEKCWNGEINWITPAEIPDNILYYGETVRKITAYGLKSKALKIMPIGTVVFSTRAPIGKTCILKYESACNQGFKNCICKEDINNIYLYCIFKNNTKFFNDLGTGATFKEISKSEFEKVLISVPPIELQNKFAAFVQHIDKLKFE